MNPVLVARVCSAQWRVVFVEVVVLAVTSVSIRNHNELGNSTKLTSSSSRGAFGVNVG